MANPARHFRGYKTDEFNGFVARRWSRAADCRLLGWMLAKAQDLFLRSRRPLAQTVGLCRVFRGGNFPLCLLWCELKCLYLFPVLSSGVLQTSWWWLGSAHFFRAPSCCWG